MLKSRQMFKEAQRRIVGGVNSPSRSFAAVGGDAPIFMERGEGAYLYDVDGKRYIDYLAAYGPGIWGHCHPLITAAIQEQATRGVLFGTPHRGEIEFAARLQAAIPSLEKLRFTNSGTEAVMSAIRVARAYTGRPKFIKFEGCYHGHFDAVLVKAGSGPATLGIADSAGVPAGVAQDVITVPFNDLGALEAALDKWGPEVAAVITEPIVGNFGIVMPAPGFLEGMKELTHKHGALLIYDEIITNFRLCYGGAQNLLGVEPDLTTLGKAIGGGLPIGAYGGKQEIMDFVAPLGPSYQAGTMAGNPLAMASGLAALELLSEPGLYERLDRLAGKLADGLLELARARGLAVQLNRIGSMFTLFFTDEPVTDYASAQKASAEQYGRFFLAILEEGVHLAPSRFEAWFVSVAHTEADIDFTLEAAKRAFQKV